ncbi:RagB/SusD family nutrient uptake outer membrane protein [Parabacteroides sp. PF5-6]|uniref:RagB/SusD family nutrient uptake outer membrane protein n=1 Tax=Parabacteroides sp. PF5-6 TaxID=1742403 RepID=UPI002404CD05|nr:RagB/SusD family nutrient uptake outer membrane protein [Parabacteroides sp. PF5-6]MDF9830933.1 hypothetical protein [Parabacteroides sp. PF5-6]
MKKIVMYCMGVLLSFQLISCHDFLEEHPKTFISPSDFYKTKGQAEAGVNAIYAILTWGGGYGNFFPIGEFPTDQAILAYPGQPTYLVLEQMTFDSANGIFETMWKEHYDGINKANLAIKRIPDTPEITEADKNSLLGEAYFLRALYYFNLVRWFGDIPLLTTPTEKLQELEVYRESQELVYQQIVNDLQFAVNNLPDTPRQTGRAGKVAAKALLGKTYATMAGEPLKQSDKWSLAKTILGEVISDPSRHLFPDCIEMWKEENENHEEFIFSAQFNGTDYNNYNPRRFAPRSSNIQGGESYGEIAPSQLFLDSFDPEDLRLGLFKTEYPRYNSTDIVVFDKPFCFKYFDICNNGQSGINFPIIRYADVLLLYAEASNEVSYGEQKAFDCLNAIRNRAGLSSLTIAEMNQNEFRKNVSDERNHELCFEGHRWFDLIRTGQFFNTLQAAGKNVKENQKLFPIPQRERDINPNLEQNPGY